jgi:hypothetical protein
VKVRIDKGVPPPKPRQKFRSSLDGLSVGESFSVDVELRPQLRNAIGNLRRDGSTKRFVISTRIERGRERVRVWRAS